MDYNFDDSNFELEVLKSEVPVLVEFWAPWCAPCHLMKPILEELSADFEGKNIKIGLCNADENSEAVERHGILNIPTFLLFVNGEEKERLSGGLQKEKLVEVIEKYLNN